MWDVSQTHYSYAHELINHVLHPLLADVNEQKRVFESLLMDTRIKASIHVGVTLPVSGHTLIPFYPPPAVCGLLLSGVSFP